MRFKRVLVACAVASAVSAGALGATAQAADGSYGGRAFNTVTCNTATHTVTVSISSVGNGVDMWHLDNSLFNHQTLEVWAKLSYTRDGVHWTTDINWRPLASDGGRRDIVVPNFYGTSWWYVTYAFRAPDTVNFDPFVGEWAGSQIGAYGWYYDGTYHSRTSCQS